jgi:hypothetical protein
LGLRSLLGKRGKYKKYTKVIDIFKSNMTKRISDGTISKVYVDAFTKNGCGDNTDITLAQ